LKTSLCAGVRRHPFGGGICLQELRNFLFGKICTVYAGVAFRNAPTVSKGDQVEVATLSVNNTYCSIVLQASLNDCAICIFNPLTVVAEICRRRAGDYAKGENQCDRLFHLFHSASLQKSATTPFCFNRTKQRKRSRSMTAKSLYRAFAQLATPL